MKKATKFLALIIIISLALSSCKSTGYGCHGKGKLITRVKGNGY